MFNRKKEQINMTEGPLLGKMIRYALPLIFTNLLQLFYNSADMFVVGNFCDDRNALGSVGCTASIINLILGLMLGMGAGVSVTISQSIGSGDKKRIERAVHTSVLLAVFVGIIVGVTGFFLAPALLELMKTPDVFIDKATLYVKIYFCGSIGNAMFNFCSGIMRSRGDTLRPLIFSSVGGVVNVILNLFFVIVLKMGVEGVAIATIIAQMISAVLSVIYLTRLGDACRVNLKKLRIDRGMFMSFVRIGIPAGVQGMLFSFSNMLLQGSYNQLGPLYVNANTAASNVDSYIYNVLAAFYHVALTFSSQNYGAKKYGRMWKVFGLNCACIIAVGLSLGVLSVVFAEQLVGIFDSDPAVIAEAKSRLLIMGLFYFTCGLMDTGTAMLRSIGNSVSATVITVFGVCIMRVIWIYTVFVAFPKLIVLYIVYPITWVLTFAALTLTFIFTFRKRVRKEKAVANAT